MPHVHSHEEGASHTTPVKTHHCLFSSRNMATCKWSCRSLSIASARLADMMNLFLFLLWSLTSSPRPPGSLLCGRQDHVLFSPCEMQLEAPPQPAGAEVKRRERGKKGPPRWPAVCRLWSPGPSFVSPLRGPLIRTFALSFGGDKPHTVGGVVPVCARKKSLCQKFPLTQALCFFVSPRRRLN